MCYYEKSDAQYHTGYWRPNIYQITSYPVKSDILTSPNNSNSTFDQFKYFFYNISWTKLMKKKEWSTMSNSTNIVPLFHFGVFNITSPVLSLLKNQIHLTDLCLFSQLVLRKSEKFIQPAQTVQSMHIPQLFCAHTCSIIVSVNSWISINSARSNVRSVNLLYSNNVVRSFAPLDFARFNFEFDWTPPEMQTQ